MMTNSVKKIFLIKIVGFLLFVFTFIFSWLGLFRIRYLQINSYDFLHLYLSSQTFEKTIKENPKDSHLLRIFSLIPKVKQYARNLGLCVKGQYSRYTVLDGPYVLYALSACPDTSLRFKAWSFPFIGKIPYLGFFSRTRAKQAERKISTFYKDTLIRGVPAFSTLGFLPDPLHSGMLRYGDTFFIETVFHELTHATIYIPGEEDLNESFAQFIGQEATKRFLNDSTVFTSQVDSEEILREELIKKTYLLLKELYQSGKTRRKILKKKEKIIEDFKINFSEIGGNSNQKWNNASFATFYLYHRSGRKKGPNYQKILVQKYKNNLKSMIFAAQKKGLSAFR